MKNLISMVKRIEQIEALPKDSINWTYKRFEQVILYKNFIIKKLELWMFVPCGMDGDVLEEPERIYFSTDFDYKAELYLFQEAKNRVLFEGFESVDTRTNGKRICFKLSREFRKSNIDQIESDEYGLFFYNSSMKKARIHKVECLLKFNELVLTPTALKQIGYEKAKV